MDRKQMYFESKQAVISLVDESNQYVNVPACPEWHVRDVIAHLVGQVQDISTGNTDGGGTDAWTAAQVDRFRNNELADLLIAWDRAITDAGEQSGDILRMVVPDLIVHEHDIRGALWNSDNRENPALAEMAENFMQFEAEQFGKSGLPSVKFVMGGHETQLGEGDPGLELNASAYEVTRVLLGRRSKAQILELHWSTDPTPWLEHMLLMPPRETDLIE